MVSNGPSFSSPPVTPNTNAGPAPSPTPTTTPPPPVSVSTVNYSQAPPPFQPKSSYDPTEIIGNLPKFLQELSPPEQNKLLSYLFTTDILDQLFKTLDQAPSKDAFHSLTNTLFKNGNMSQMSGNNAALSDTVKAAMKDSIQEIMVQILVQGKNGASSSTDAPLTLTIPNQGFALGQDPASDPMAKTPFPPNLTALIGEAATAAIKGFVMANMPTAGTQGQLQGQVSTGLQSQTPQQIQFQLKLENLLSELLTLNLSNSSEPNIEVMVPTQPDPAGFPKAVAELQQKLHTLIGEFATLGQFAKDEHLDIGQLQKMLAVPQEMLAHLKSMTSDDQTSYTLMKTWVDNSRAIETAIAQRGIDRQHARYEFLQSLVMLPIASANADMMAEQRQKQLIFDQILLSVPNLLNFYKVKDAVEALAANLKSQGGQRLIKHKVLLFNAAREVVIVALGKPNPEYNDVGIFHEHLRHLAIKMTEVMPDSAPAMSLEQMELISFLLKDAFEAIKADDPYRFVDILKRHPRTMLYFMVVDSPLCDDMRFPNLPVILRGEIQPQELNVHVTKLLAVMKKFEKMSEFLKYQPRVLEKLLYETKNDPSSEATKDTLKIVQKAVADCTDFVDLEE